MARFIRFISIFLVCSFFWVFRGYAFPLQFVDSSGNQAVLEKPPEKVVSLVPSVTEIIVKIGAEDFLKGMTYHNIYPQEVADIPVVGGFFTPSVSHIAEIDPDLIIVSSLHRKVIDAFPEKKLMVRDMNGIEEAFDTILLFGRVFGRKANAEELVAEIKAQIDLIAKKIERIPDSRRKRVIRLMGRETVMTPGDDSFQNEMIRAAGGIPPTLNRQGDIVDVSLEEWQAFNPELIYGCGGDRKAAEILLNRPGWKDVDAVKNGMIFNFPCDLTCRASTRMGYFISWLASTIYPQAFLDKEAQVLPDRIDREKPLPVDIEYVGSARILYSTIYDFPHKSLVVEFNRPLAVSSTLEGYREGVRTVGNSYSSPPTWGLYHYIGIEKSRKTVLSVLGKSEKDAGFLFTGADMDNLAIVRKKFREMEVTALVTAGVRSNAVRMGKDTGNYYEPGTINVILLPNMKLTPRAMNRAMISATEGKTAALWDMDIRSTYTPLIHPATGTGTDNVLVVEGAGVRIDNAGGHSKMGELIAQAVYDGVHQAIYKQNGFVRDRNIFQRLRERKISMYDLISLGDCHCDIPKSDLSYEFEQLLLNPRYAGFMEAVLSISDRYEQGLIQDLTAFENWCKDISEDIAGTKIENRQNFIGDHPLPKPMEIALNAMFNGIYGKLK